MESVLCQVLTKKTLRSSSETLSQYAVCLVQRWVVTSPGSHTHTRCSSRACVPDLTCPVPFPLWTRTLLSLTVALCGPGTIVCPVPQFCGWGQPPCPSLLGLTLELSALAPSTALHLPTCSGTLGHLLAYLPPGACLSLLHCTCMTCFSSLTFRCIWHLPHLSRNI